jgi:hypothetical protein
MRTIAAMIRAASGGTTGFSLINALYHGEVVFGETTSKNGEAKKEN